MSSTPPEMLPWPSAMNRPVRASGVALVAPAAKTSPLVTNTYWPFKLASVYLPTGVGGLTIVLLPLQAALQSATAAERVRRRRFIAHLAGLPFVLASSRRSVSSGSLECSEPQQLARPSAQCGRRSRCSRRGPMVHRRCARYRRDSTRDDRHRELPRGRDEHRPGRKKFEEANERQWEACWRPTRI